VERATVKEILTEKQKEHCKSIYWTASSLLAAGNPRTEVRGLMALRRQCLQETQMALFRPANKNVLQDIRISFIKYFSCVIYNLVYSVQTENKNSFSKILVCNMCEFSVFYIRRLYSVCMCVPVCVCIYIYVNIYIYILLICVLHVTIGIWNLQWRVNLTSAQIGQVPYIIYTTPIFKFELN
jgi:hypothetical protein